MMQRILKEDDQKTTFKEMAKKCRIFAKGAKKRGKNDEFEKYMGLIKKYEGGV